MHTGCVFCGIVARRIPAHFVHEDERFVAFLDIHPIRTGHMQIVPRDHYAYFDDMPHELAAEILAFAQRSARGMKSLYGVPRVGFMFSGADVAHVHAHVVPVRETTDITSRAYIVEENVTFALPARPADDDLAQTAQAVRSAIFACD